MTAEAAAPALPADERERLQRLVKSRLGELDIASLLEMLDSLGWPLEHVRFVGYHTTVSQPGLIHDLEFSAEPRQVRITVNLGLLAAQSVMPSYFFQTLEETGFDANEFINFLGFFDHQILSNLLQNIYPETNRQLYPDWEQHKRRLLQLLDLRSCATLHWLFQTVFPELGVVVDKAPLAREVNTGAIKLGIVTLGSDAVFGRRASVPVSGRRITLSTTTERAGSGKPWPAEVKERLHQLVFPIVGAVGLDLEVYLVMTEDETWMGLDDESFLGYDRIQGGTASYRRIKVHAGYVVNLQGGRP